MTPMAGLSVDAKSPRGSDEPMVAGETRANASLQLHDVRKVYQGDHGSLLSPASSAAVTAEMQGEMASMLVSAGNAVQVSNTSVIRTQ